MLIKGNLSARGRHNLAIAGDHYAHMCLSRPPPSALHPSPFASPPFTQKRETDPSPGPPLTSFSSFRLPPFRLFRPCLVFLFSPFFSPVSLFLLFFYSFNIFSPLFPSQRTSLPMWLSVRYTVLSVLSFSLSLSLPSSSSVPS